MHKYLALLLANEHCSQSANIEVDSTTLLQVQIQDYYTIGYSLLQDGTLLSAVCMQIKIKQPLVPRFVEYKDIWKIFYYGLK